MGNEVDNIILFARALLKTVVNTGLIVAVVVYAAVWLWGIAARYSGNDNH